MNSSIRNRIALAAFGFVIVAEPSFAQTDVNSSTEPMQPSVTEPAQPSITEPMQPTIREPRPPATTEPMEPEFGREVPTVRGPAGSVAETVVGQERAAPIERHSNFMESTPTQRVQLFDAVDADGDLRVQWGEIREQEINIDRETFEELDVDNTDDLDRSEFVGVGSHPAGSS